MKSEHRRELHANELEKIAEALGKFFEKHGGKVLVGVVIAAAAGIGIYWYVNSRGNERASGTQSLMTASSAEDYLSRVADDPDLQSQPLGLAARLVAAQMQLQSGIELYGTSSVAARDELKKAKKNFDEVLASDKIKHELRERALYLRAVAVESLSDGDTSEAVAAYKELLTEFPNSAYKELAETRIKQLEQEPVKEFYAFLATADRKPRDRKRPTDLQGSGLPPGHPPVPGMPGTSRSKTRVDRTVEPDLRLPPAPPLLRMDLERPPKAGGKKEGKKRSGAAPFPPAPAEAKKAPGKKNAGPALKPNKPAEKPKPKS